MFTSWAFEGRWSTLRACVKFSCSRPRGRAPGAGSEHSSGKESKAVLLGGSWGKEWGQGRRAIWRASQVGSLCTPGPGPPKEAVVRGLAGPGGAPSPPFPDTRPLPTVLSQLVRYSAEGLLQLGPLGSTAFLPDSKCLVDDGRTRTPALKKCEDVARPAQRLWDFTQVSRAAGIQGPPASQWAGARWSGHSTVAAPTLLPPRASWGGGLDGKDRVTPIQKPLPSPWLLAEFC